MTQTKGFIDHALRGKFNAFARPSKYLSALARRGRDKRSLGRVHSRLFSSQARTAQIVRPSWDRPLTTAATTFMTVYCLIYLTWTCVLSVHRISGPSMYPFLNPDAASTPDRDWVWLWRWPWEGSGVAGARKIPTSVDRSGNISIQTPHNMKSQSIAEHDLSLHAQSSTQDLGLIRGDIVAFWSPLHPERQQIKRIVALPGDYVHAHAPYPRPGEIVPFGHVWVEGDQTQASKTMDSNYYGPISANLIVGRVGGIVWPWSRIGRLQPGDWRPRRMANGQPQVIEGGEIHHLQPLIIFE